MATESNAEKIARFQQALEVFISRVEEDRTILAVVLVGSLTDEVIWKRESLNLWIIEADGVTKRLRSDGKDERIYRILVENDINIHAQLIPRTRFRQMVEGSSRTAFSCNFFAERKLVYCKDQSIENWFDQANNVATKDQEKELLAFTTWTIHTRRYARKRLEIKQDIDLARQGILDAAHSIAYTEIIRMGEICEDAAIYRAIDAKPELFQVIYLDVMAKRKNKKVMLAALDTIDEYLEQNHRAHLKPLLKFLKKQKRVVPLSEISDHFAFSQLYPFHLESACEWLEERGMLEKHAMPFKLTKKSREDVEEPAYFVG